MLNPIGALEIGRSHRSAGAVDQGEDLGLLGHFSHPAFCDCDCETSGANHLPGAAELSVGDLGVVRNFQVGRKHVLCEPVGGNIEFTGKPFYDGDDALLAIDDPIASIEFIVESTESRRVAVIEDDGGNGNARDERFDQVALLLHRPDISALIGRVQV